MLTNPEIIQEVPETAWAHDKAEDIAWALHEHTTFQAAWTESEDHISSILNKAETDESNMYARHTAVVKEDWGDPAELRHARALCLYLQAQQIQPQADLEIAEYKKKRQSVMATLADSILDTAEQVYDFEAEHFAAEPTSGALAESVEAVEASTVSRIEAQKTQSKLMTIRKTIKRNFNDRMIYSVRQVASTESHIVGVLEDSKIESAHTLVKVLEIIDEIKGNLFETSPKDVLEKLMDVINGACYDMQQVIDAHEQILSTHLGSDTKLAEPETDEED